MQRPYQKFGAEAAPDPKYQKNFRKQRRPYQDSGAPWWLPIDY
jgi:hypothetical protein